MCVNLNNVSLLSEEEDIFMYSFLDQVDNWNWPKIWPPLRCLGQKALAIKSCLEM